MTQADPPPYSVTKQKEVLPRCFIPVDGPRIYGLISALSAPATREMALLELGNIGEVIPDLAPLLWYSFGSIAALLQEIIQLYPSLQPPVLTSPRTNRVCNVLVLLRCVAAHPDTRHAFVAAQIPLFLYPLLEADSKACPCIDQLRHATLYVFYALFNLGEQDVVLYLLNTGFLQPCLKIMMRGRELHQTLATCMMHKIILHPDGLAHVCHTLQSFTYVATILKQMVLSISKEPSARLLEEVVKCYLRLSEDSRARPLLRDYLPTQLRDCTFEMYLKDDRFRLYFLKLHENLSRTFYAHHGPNRYFFI